MHDKQHALPSRAGGVDKHRFGINAGPTTDVPAARILLGIQVQHQQSAISN
jgi:hypothetical protein